MTFKIILSGLVLLLAMFFYWRNYLFPHSPTETYSISQQLNAQGTGSLIIWNETYQESSNDLFVHDFKHPPFKPLYLGKLDFEDAPFLREVVWSKDEMMCAVRETKPKFRWKTGYDWRRHKKLLPQEILASFQRAGGIGKVATPENSRRATYREAGQFEPLTTLD